MSEILFSHSYFYRLDPKQWKNRTPFPPLGTLYAASLMRSHGHTIELFDTNLLQDASELPALLKFRRPQYFVLYDDGFNYLTKMCLTRMREACFGMIATAKKAGVKVIVSSSDATDHFAQYLDNGADYIIKGEGEMTLLDLITTLDQGKEPSEVAGIAYRRGTQTMLNQPRAVLHDLDSLPLPAWDLVDMNSYKLIWLESGLPFTLNIATTRGCPYKCNWCAKPIYGNRYNSHSPQYIGEHVQFLRETFGVKRFWMCDDIFGLKPGWVKEFGDELYRRKLNIKYYIQSRADLLLKENTIDELASSGLEEAWIGAESASQKILDAMEKGTKVSQIYEATRLLKARGIRVAFFLQFGYLGESLDDIEKTVNMVRELAPDNIGVSVSYPLPGTKFYEKVRDQLGEKANWRDSDDMDLMFKGSFKSEYYKRLQRFIHKEFRKAQGIRNLKVVAANPLRLSPRKFKSIAKLGYYIPGAFADTLILKRMQDGRRV